MFINKGEKYLAILPQRDGIYGYWNHIALVDASMADSGTKKFLTQGTWEVTDIVAYDEEEHFM